MALALGLLAALLAVRTHLDAIARDRLLVLADAFTLPLFIASLVVIFFLTLASAAGIARERESGTLEVLFYGPVDHWSYVLGKHLALVAGYGTLGLALVALLGGLRRAHRPAARRRLPGLGAAVDRRGGGDGGARRLLLGADARGAGGDRAAAGDHGCCWWRSGSAAACSATSRSPTTPARCSGCATLVIGLNGLVGFLSPVATFERGIEAAKRGDPLAYLGALALLLAQCLAGLVGAVVALRRRGVRR